MGDERGERPAGTETRPADPRGGRGKGGGAAEAKREKSFADWLRENVEAVVVAVVLALIIRHFAMEAFVIPTGSMAPTLLGRHVFIACTNCGLRQPVSNRFAEDDAARFLPSYQVRFRCPDGKEHEALIPEEGAYGGEAQATCPDTGDTVTVAISPKTPLVAMRRIRPRCSNCGVRLDLAVEPGDVSGGNKILVNKFIYRIRPPRRWEVFVFKSPEHPDKNFIKRIGGLGGETIQIRNGDVFIDGALARKPESVQEALWRPIYDMRRVEEKPGAAAWASEDATAFAVRTDAIEGAAPEGALRLCTYARPIVDLSPYNEERASGDYPVGDVRLRFRAAADPSGSGGALVAEIEETGVTAKGDLEENAFRLRLPLGEPGSGAGATLERDGTVVATAPGIALAATRPHDVAFENWDDRVRATVDGRVVIDWLYESRLDRTTRSAVRLGVEGAHVRFEGLALDRDVYYIARTGVESHGLHPYRIPDGHFFAMGDNSSNSTDSRYWGTVPEEYVLGRAFVVFWPALPWDFQVKLIR